MNITDILTQYLCDPYFDVLLLILIVLLAMLVITLVSVRRIVRALSNIVRETN